ncbi:MAG: hypothetical protein ACYTFY_08365, partial [Planctomycetota bacterium]
MPHKNAQMALDVINGKKADGIPTWELLTMEWSFIDRLAGVPEGTYQQEPEATVRKQYENIGVCMVDQWIPTNPLKMTNAGYDSSKAGETATTGKHDIELNGMKIKDPEDVVANMEQHYLPYLEEEIKNHD